MEFVRPLEPILIIDDMNESRLTLNHILTELGFDDIIESSDFDLAKSALKNKAPNVIFLDIDLPNLSSDGIVEFINKHYPHSYIVMCSGHNSLESVQNTWEMAAKEFIEKPFNKKKVDSVMKRLELI
jgi:two-component system chemotaxis response regulator CheY